MEHIAPPLTREGFRTGCSQPGPARPMSQTVDLGNATLTFTSSGIIIATDDLFMMKQLSDAKGAVGDRLTRITRKVT